MTSPLSASVDDSSSSLLTPQQNRVIEAYVRTGLQKAVAAELGISYQTVKNHLSSIYRRLDTSGMLQTLFLLGWVSPPVPGVPKPRPCGYVVICTRAEGHTELHGKWRGVAQ